MGQEVDGRPVANKKNKTTHGMCGTSTYSVWSNMLQRCNNTKNTSYKDYGGRGIKVCKKWHNFKEFLKDMGVKPTRKTLDRIKNSGNYKKSNCRWATKKQQNRNTRVSRYARVNGGKVHIKEFCQILGISSASYYYRKKQGWSDRKIDNFYQGKKRYKNGQVNCYQNRLRFTKNLNSKGN